MIYKTITVTAPTAEPITLTEAKEQLRLETAFVLDDDYINALISVARDRAENYCNRYFTEQEVAIVYFEPFPLPGDSKGNDLSILTLPFPDLVTVDAITYTDTQNATQIFTTFSFNSDTQQVIADDTFPTDAVNFKVVVTTAAPVEFIGAKQGMLMNLTDMYELRTESVLGVSVAVNPAVNLLLHQYRVNQGI